MSGFVFVSYSHADRDYATGLADYLTDNDVDYWMDHRLDYGVAWPDVIEQRIDDCSALIVIMTERAWRSTWVRNELEHARRRNKPILPLLLSGEVFFGLLEAQHVDVRDGGHPGRRFAEQLRAMTSKAVLPVRRSTGRDAVGGAVLPVRSSSGRDAVGGAVLPVRSSAGRDVAAREPGRTGAGTRSTATVVPAADRLPAEAGELIKRFAQRIPEVRQAVLVTEDGLLAAADRTTRRDEYDGLAAGVTALRIGGQFLAALAGSVPRVVVADLDAGTVVVDATAGEYFVAFYAVADADLGAALHQMAELSQSLRGDPPAATVDRRGASEPVENDQSWVLDSFVSRTAGTTHGLVASVDGFALTTNHGFPFRSGEAAVLACSLFGSGRGLGKRINGGSVHQVRVETHDGCCMVTPFNDSAVLLQFLTDNADPGISHYEATQLARHVGHAFLNGN